MTIATASALPVGRSAWKRQRVLSAAVGLHVPRMMRDGSLDGVVLVPDVGCSVPVRIPYTSKVEPAASRRRRHRQERLRSPDVGGGGEGGPEKTIRALHAKTHRPLTDAVHASAGVDVACFETI